MRQSILAFSSLALVCVAGGAILSAAHAQAVPVRYGADPNLDVMKNSSPAALGVRDELAAMGYAVEPAPAPPSGAARAVTVGAGDTVYAIARRYGANPSDIIAENGLIPPYKLSIGQRLYVPVGVERAAPPPVSRDAFVPLQQERRQVIRAAARAESMAPARLETAYRVAPGDTLFGLSRRFGVPVQELAAINGLSTPYALSIDQQLIIPGALPAAGGVPSRPQALASTPSRAASPARAIPASGQAPEPILISKNPDSRFAWPLRGTILTGFGMTKTGLRNDGINIAAPMGAPIRAAADGMVVYTGAELEGYGNLLLIRHADGWVSAYAHTDSIVVRKGDEVQQGQIVAKVGRSGAVDRPQLHFELRHELQPKDPLAALNGTYAQAASYQ